MVQLALLMRGTGEPDAALHSDVHAMLSWVEVEPAVMLCSLCHLVPHHNLNLHSKPTNHQGMPASRQTLNCVASQQSGPRQGARNEIQQTIDQGHGGEGRKQQSSTCASTAHPNLLLYLLCHTGC
jgi:hypothetical protein